MSARTTSEGPSDAGGGIDVVIDAARAADDKQGSDVVILEVGPVLAITGWFVICDAANTRHVKTLVDGIEHDVFERHGIKPVRVEGLDTRHWVLIDYGDFVVHVFGPDARAYYELERLWADVARIDWDRASA